MNYPPLLTLRGEACQLSSRHPRMVSLHKQSLPSQALKALAREGGLRLYSRTLEGAGVNLQT